MSENSIVDTAVYEEHYGWTPKSVLLIIVCLVFAAAAVFLWPSSPVLATIAVLSFGAGGIALLSGVLLGRLALRVDQTGVTIGRSFLHSEIPGRTVPWQDLQAVLLFTQVTGRTRTSYVSVHRREGLPPLPGSQSGLALRTSKALMPGIPADALASCVAINIWSINKERLAQAIELNSPGTPLVDLR